MASPSDHDLYAPSRIHVSPRVGQESLDPDVLLSVPSTPEAAPNPPSLQANKPLRSWFQVLKDKRAQAKQRRPPDHPTTTRKAVHASEKRAICEMSMANPDMTHQQLADHFLISRSIVTRTLAKKDNWLKSQHVEGQTFSRKRLIRYHEVEYHLERWLLACKHFNVIVTDNMIREQAIIVAEYEGMRGGGHDYQFHCGRSWLRGFKKRYGITDGVITRVGYTPADLAREKAYGSYPLDDPFWSQLPDEHGNVPLPFGRDKTEFDDMDFEFDGPFVVYKPRVDPAATPTDYAALPPSGLATPSEDVTPLISQSQRHHVSFDLSSSSFDTSQSGVDSVSESKAWSFTNDPPNGQSAWEASYRQCHFHESFTRETSL